MSSSNWLPYYVLFLQQQQRARKAEEERKKAEEETQRAKEEAIQAQQEQVQEEQSQPTEPTATEGPTPTTEAKPTTDTKPTSTYTPKPTDCELLYEIGSSDYALCENTKAQNAAANSNIAMIMMCCVAIGVGIAAIIVHCVDRSVDKKYGKNGGGCTFYA